MITRFDVKSKDCRTEGCECCSTYFDIDRDKEEILEEAKENILEVRDICEYYNIDFTVFVEQFFR